MIQPLQANWQALNDTDIIALLRNSEGKNSTDRALFLEAARRIEAQQDAIAAAVQAEREITDQYRADWRAVCNALNTSPDSKTDVVLSKIAAIRARSNGNTEQAQPVRTIKRRGDVNKEAEKAYYSDEPPF